MAYEIPGLCISFAAGESLADAQFRWGKLDTAGKVVRCSVDGEHALGIIQNNPAADAAVSVMVFGVSKIVIAASEALIAGNVVGTTSVGTATKVEMTATGADIGDVGMGVILESVTGSSTAGALGTVLIRPVGKPAG